MAFVSCTQGNLKDVFITESEIIDRFVGNQLWLWGLNYGRLGNNSGVKQSSPVQTVTRGTNWKQVSLGDYTTASIKTDGTLWLWGNNFNGNLGDNSSTDKSSPVQTVTTGTNWKQVSLGQTNSAAIKTDGTLWIWGANEYGQLGSASTITACRSSPIQTVTTGNNWKQVSVGRRHVGAIKTDGTLWMWGRGTSAEIGDNAVSTRNSPVQTIATGTNWKQISLGDCHSAAIKTDGTLWIWGTGTYGRLGNNSTVNQSSPVQTVSNVSTWKQVSLSEGHSAAIKTDGTLWLWGNGVCGALGNNSTINQSSPIQTISTSVNWKQVDLGSRTTGAIKTDGTLWLWGHACCGTLGTNSTVNQSSPIQTISLGNNWKQVSIANNFSSAITFTEF